MAMERSRRGSDEMLGMRSLKGPVSLAIVNGWKVMEWSSLLNPMRCLVYENPSLVYWIYWIYDDSEYWSIESDWVYSVYWIKILVYGIYWSIESIESMMIVNIESIESIESIPTPMWIFVVFLDQDDGIWRIMGVGSIPPNLSQINLNGGDGLLFPLLAKAAPKSKRILFT